DGTYSLQVSVGATLLFSSVGYVKEEIEVGNQSVIDLVMVPDIQQLSELVVVGYGSVRKSVMTGAISTVEMEKIQPVSTQRVDQMLQGRASGVLVLNT